MRTLFNHNNKILVFFKAMMMKRPTKQVIDTIVSDFSFILNEFLGNCDKAGEKRDILSFGQGGDFKRRCNGARNGAVTSPPHCLFFYIKKHINFQINDVFKILLAQKTYNFRMF